jgi:peroxiredoxin
LENGKNLKAKYGVDKIIVVSVNDAFVMAEWKNKIAKESNEVEFLADPAGQFAVNTGLEVDLTAAGLGKRCKRFSAIVDNGKVVALNVEDSPGDFKVTGSERITEQLQKLK